MNQDYWVYEWEILHVTDLENGQVFILSDQGEGFELVQYSSMKEVEGEEGEERGAVSMAVR